MTAFLLFIVAILALAAGFRAGRHHERTLAASARSVAGYKAADTRRAKRLIAASELSLSSGPFYGTALGEGAES